jgi:hypothetical protein
MTEIEPVARTKPITLQLTGDSYMLTFLVCRCCGQRVALLKGAWRHKITGRAECGELPFGGLYSRAPQQGRG